MSRNPSYSYVFKVQRIILLVFYSTTAIALAFLLAKGLLKLMPEHPYLLLVISMLYLAFVVLLGALIHVISYIPFNLAAAFDPIKNAMVRGEIHSIEELGIRLCEFTTDFFNFAFLDIQYAWFQTEQLAPLSHLPHAETEKFLAAYGMLEKSKVLEKLERAGKLQLNKKNYHIYILPLRFGEDYLGYMALLSKHRISRFFAHFLNEYEEYFLDDQIMLFKYWREGQA